MKCTFEAISEDQPGAQWQQLFTRHWPAYRGWFLRGGVSGRPSYLDCRRALREHMPLWLPVWERMSELAGGGDIEARFLSLWCPPAYIAGCSQAVWVGDQGPALLRNYDYAPALLEGAWLATRWGGQRVLAMSDCLAGALDGINESGLALSLSFGGRKARGPGFGIPLLLRYVLEFATTTREAAALLSRIPVHMTYSVTAVDRNGHFTTVYIAPDRQPEIVPLRGVTNHQHAVEWPEHANATHTRERAAALGAMLAQSRSLPEMQRAMLAPPLFQCAYGRGYGTLYTAIYRPRDCSAELVWPGGGWLQNIESFEPGVREVALGNVGGPAPPPETEKPRSRPVVHSV